MFSSHCSTQFVFGGIFCFASLFYGVIPLFGPKWIPKRFVESKLRERVKRLERLISGHLMQSADERSGCEGELRKAETALAGLPRMQAERLEEFQKSLAEVEKALASLK